jgi:hypothetical protein
MACLWWTGSARAVAEVRARARVTKLVESFIVIIRKEGGKFGFFFWFCFVEGSKWLLRYIELSFR